MNFNFVPVCSSAVTSFILQANVSEADHPLLCEGTRRQRGDLAVMLLVHYKDDPDKLAKIMEKLLDREIHPLYKAPLLSSFYTNNPTPMGHSCTHGSRQHHHHVRHRGDLEAGMAAMALDRPASNGGSNSMTQRPTSGPSNHRDQIPTWEDDYATWQAGQSSAW